MKALSNRDRRCYADLLAEMAARGVHESRLMYVYHYYDAQSELAAEDAVNSYLEARRDGDSNEVACQG